MRERDHDTLLVAAEGDELERIGPHRCGRGWRRSTRNASPRSRNCRAITISPLRCSACMAQRGAEQVALPQAAVRDGHGIQRDSRALAAKGRAALVAALGARSNWVDRFLVAPLAQVALPPLVARGVPAVMLAAAGVAAGVGGLAALAMGWAKPGLAAVVVALALFALSDVLAWLRDERRLIAIVKWAEPWRASRSRRCCSGYQAGTRRRHRDRAVARADGGRGGRAGRARGGGGAAAFVVGDAAGLSADPAARRDRRPAADRAGGGRDGMRSRRWRTRSSCLRTRIAELKRSG